MSDPKEIKKKADILQKKAKEIPTDMQIEEFHKRNVERKREIEKRIINQQIEEVEN